MKVLGVELGGGVDTSTYDFRDDLITELEKCIEIPFAMNSFTESRLFGQQEGFQFMVEGGRKILIKKI